MIFFLDTSALVKRYLNEPGSAYIRRLFLIPDSVFYQTFLTPIEITSAFYRRQRTGDLTIEELSLVLQAYASNAQEEYLLVPYSETLLTTAGALIARHPLRALDALQLAAALKVREDLPEHAGALMFVCADDRLVAAARHEHLRAVNPETIS